MNPNPNVKPETGPAEPWEQWSQRPGAMDDICDAVLSGTTLSAWAQERAFRYYTVLRWVRADPGRTNQYRELADFRIDRLADEIIALGDDSSQDLCTDAKGKTAFNTAHFRRQGRQIETRKCLLRQLTTARRLTKDEKPQWSYQDEILKLGNDDTPYDPTGLITATKPAYNPGPPPLSRPSPSSQSTIVSASVPNPNLNPTPNLSPVAVTAPLLRPLERGRRSAEGWDEGVGPPTTNNKQQITGERTFPSYRAYLRAISESGWVEGTPLPFVYRPTPDTSLLNPTPNPSPVSESAMDEPLAKVPAQADSTKQPPKAQIGAILPKVDWYGLLGMQKLSAFLTLFLLFFFTAAANLHASIHSLSIPLGDHGDRPSFDPPATLSDPRCQTWFPPGPELNSPRATNNELRTNPSETFRHSRDAPEPSLLPPLVAAVSVPWLRRYFDIVW